MTFLDTSALYALADRRDKFHLEAKRRFATLLEAEDRLWTHNYVLVELMALARARLGLEAALTMARDLEKIECVWVEPTVHAEALGWLSSHRNLNVGLVDAVSFLLMRKRGTSVALAFDPDFEQVGFVLYRTPPLRG